jgi:hypothetical protein
MKDNNAYLKQGKWKADRVYKILTNSFILVYLSMESIKENHRMF